MNNKKMLANVLKVNKDLRKKVRQETSLLNRIKKVNQANEKMADHLRSLINMFSDVKVPELPA